MTTRVSNCILVSILTSLTLGCHGARTATSQDSGSKVDCAIYALIAKAELLFKDGVINLPVPTAARASASVQKMPSALV